MQRRRKQASECISSEALRSLAATFAFVWMLLLPGCGNLFFYPSQEHVITPDQIGLQYEDVHLTTPDGESLHGWLLPAKGELRGSLYFLHGNAENISTHIINVMWLPAQGYQVFLLDYRGFGRSTGKPDIGSALIDAETGYRWLIARPETKQAPVFLMGQSLGAALTVSFSAQVPGVHQQVRGIVIDAAFSSFRGIAREKLDAFWLTKLIQHPLSWLIPGTYDPIDHIPRLSPIPLFIIHSERDQIVPFHHGEGLYAAALQPKWLLKTTTTHNGTFAVKHNRLQVLQFLSALSPPLTPTLNTPLIEARHTN